MSLQHISEFPPPQQPPKRRVSKDKLPTANIEFRTEVPFEERVPETRRHFEARTTLFLVLRKEYNQDAMGRENHAVPGRDIAIGSDQFVYFDRKNARKCFSPDLFVKLDSTEEDIDKWLVWEKGILDLVVEIVSDSDRESNVWDEKFAKYEASGVQEVVRFDAIEREPLTVWDRVGNKLIERSRNGLTSHECKTLGLYWTVGIDERLGPMLRFARDRECTQILPTPDEGELRLAHELADERRARALAEHEKMLAEQLQRDEAQARARAEHDKMLAEQLQRHAETKRIEAERKRRASDKKRREETKARAVAEQKQREEAQARAVAEQKQRDETQARQRLETENERLRAELEKLRLGSR
jgi:flagellar biosynthesis GTPase FlhF